VGKAKLGIMIHNWAMSTSEMIYDWSRGQTGKEINGRCSKGVK